MVLRVMGIDPGSRVTGYGVLEGDGRRILHVAHGVIRPPAAGALPERLGAIHHEVGRLLSEHSPAAFSIEEAFFAKNARSALVLGQARGAAICAATGCGVPVFEYTPMQIKQAVVGYGKAEKSQVAAMMQYLLRIREPIEADAADALAAALCHLSAGLYAARVREAQAR